MRGLLIVDDVEVRLAEVALVADVRRLEAVLLLAHQELAQVLYRRLLLHFNDLFLNYKVAKEGSSITYLHKQEVIKVDPSQLSRTST